jgi:hypothetical protein
MCKEEKLKVVFESSIRDRNKVIEAVKSGWKSTGFWYEEERKAIYDLFINHDLKKSKQHFFLCGIIDEFEINKLNQPILDYGLNHLSYALLSDCQELITRYADFSHSYYEKSIKCGLAAPTYIIQCIIKDDWGNFNDAMEIMKIKTLKKYPIMQLDMQVFKGIAQKDKTKIENALTELLTPKMHKIRNKHNILLNEFISHPALGYAKLAWLKGIEVEIDNPLVPKELLPFKPLENYLNEYAFLDEININFLPA